MKVAIVHYWLVGMRGGEKVVEDLCHLFPQADIYTHVADPDNLSDTIRRHKITETFIGRLPGAKTHYQKYLPLMPRALEALDLSGYDLVISSEAGPAKGVVTAPDCVHLCYCHSPMRYIWDQYHVYRANAGLAGRAAMSIFAPWLRVWDHASAARVDHVVANSDFVRRRIAKAWGRSADVVFPPVDLDAFQPGDPAEVEDFYLYVGELAAYKRPDLLVETFNESGRPLIIIGDGSEKAALEKVAKPNIRFLGRASFETLRSHYKRCRALLFPGVEDFGIIPLEAMASGRPVVAYGRGGALETVRDGVTGVFFHDHTPAALNGAIDRLENELLGTLDPQALQAHVAAFGRDRFRQEMATTISDLLSSAQGGRA
ncbi:glycosyltransferase family 4 protein [Aliishimia ponticola]|uniref:Glycosyltransferase family 4 protein n=1 Tax=Aliishimia ponticola TaxID=2499833 RepID=A0A4S4N8D7_9RHOB|nr:glycosyltransferase family 4 protein [Aliishimia ponticola]